MKKKIIGITIIIVFIMIILGIYIYIAKENSKKVTINLALETLKLKDERTLEFLDNKKVSDYIEILIEK